MELSKSQKKVARQLINEALQRECKTFLEEVKEILPQKDRTPHEVYLQLFKKVDDFDEYIAKQYDRVSGAYYFITILNLYYNNVLTEDDINLFDEEIRQKLIELKQTL